MVAFPTLQPSLLQTLSVVKKWSSLVIFSPVSLGYSLRMYRLRRHVGNTDLIPKDETSPKTQERLALGLTRGMLIVRDLRNLLNLWKGL